ncbi:FemAB family XrtA/PEP-CTERM system-associated protein [Kordiimonas laminariae]|uniref:FemAB family XrtA/PEP-CTERM system-associated protein n=1 Tax=Kordiimonas laminariae TaxID=2917717 RepID=UPI001FF47A79|nr:FemAB family XrtA/PEP-CTERM system-associated protein [Kordiimonas laminariae]MCK0070439.1 FemAB family PEP-CTERM system-associated protein [Kordiimonas laminariae]
MDIIIREATDEDSASWDAFVSDHPDGTFCHRYGWKAVLEAGTGQKCPYLVALSGGQVVGTLPLSIRDSFLFGKAAISSMFAVYGGPLSVSEKALSLLNEKAWKITRESGANSLEYRTIQSSSFEGWVTETGVAASFQKELKETAEDILLDIPRKQRAVVRKSLKHGLHCSWEKDLDTFYALYAESVRNLGTPVFPKKLFREFLEVFEKETDIQIVYSPEGEAIASLMTFYHNDHILPYYAGGNAKARLYGAHDFMYYELMVRSAKNGFKVYDFGRSKVGTGPYKFKKNWGFEPIPLNYQFRLKEGEERKEISPQNKKFELMVKVWKKLPLPVANILGPPIARHLG